jgi:hypothetical protein
LTLLDAPPSSFATDNGRSLAGEIPPDIDNIDGHGNGVYEENRMGE